jgi:hypothetical protein
MAGTPSMVSASPNWDGNTRMISNSGGCVSLFIVPDGSKGREETLARMQTSSVGGYQGSLPYGNALSLTLIVIAGRAAPRLPRATSRVPSPLHHLPCPYYDSEPLERPRRRHRRRGGPCGHLGGVRACLARKCVRERAMAMGQWESAVVT